MKYIALLASLILTATTFAAEITLEWDDQPTPDARIQGYNIYKVVKSGGDGSPELVTYTKVNDVKIEAEERSYTVTVAAGDVFTIRAFNIVGEGPDSDYVTVPSLPDKVPGFRSMELIVESSPDLIKWGAYAVINIAARPPHQFFRLKF